MPRDGPLERRRKKNPTATRTSSGTVSSHLQKARFVFGEEEELEWTVFWERLAQHHGVSPEAFEEQYGYLYPHVRFLIQCEGHSPTLNSPRERITVGQFVSFLTYFPLEGMMDDVVWLNDKKMLWCGSHTTMLQQEMKSTGVYTSQYVDAENEDTKTYSFGDFIVRPSKTKTGKLVTSILHQGLLKHCVICVRDGALMVDGFDGSKTPRASTLRTLVEWLVNNSERSGFKRGCGEVIVPGADYSPLFHQEGESESGATSSTLDELMVRLEPYKLTLKEITAWSISDIDELLKETLQLEVVRRNRFKKYILEQRTGTTSTVSCASSSSRLWTSTTGSSQGVMLWRCTDRSGVAFRSHPKMSSIISTAQGVRSGETIEVTGEEDGFLRTLDGKYLPRVIDNKPCFEPAEATQTAHATHTHTPLNRTLHLQGNGNFFDVQITYRNLLGSGSFGKVYEALDFNTGEERAVKELSIDKSNEDLDGVLRELRLMSTLEHPNIVRFYGSHRDDSHLYLCMERMTQTLQQLISKYGNLAKFMKKYGADIVHGLQYLHDAEVVHRDIKPSNILVGSSGTAKLSDFGTGKVLPTCSASATVTANLVGTPMYMAPEVIQAHICIERAGPVKDHKSTDIWSLGLTFLEMYTGEKPWKDREPIKLMMQVANNATLVPQMPASAPADFIDVLDRTIKRDPSQRMTSSELAAHPFFQM